MKAPCLIIGLFLIIALSNVVIASSFASSSSASDSYNEMKTESLVLLRNLSSNAGVRSGDLEDIEKYLKKLLKAFEKKAGSSKGSAQIGELMESYEKYSEKLRKTVSELSRCSPENQVIASTLIEKYLNDFKDAFELDGKVSGSDEIFIEGLRRYPPGSIASHYTELWDTLSGLEAQNLPTNELLAFIDSAVRSFSAAFVASNRREFAVEMADEVIGPCLIGGFCETFNKAMDKLNELQPEP